MLADKIIPLLEGVRSTGQDRWIARCPAHDDRSPSLSIKEVADRLLLHCFAGCETYEIVSALGMELSDLFPEKRESYKPLSRPFPAADILRCLTSEITYLAVCAIGRPPAGFKTPITQWGLRFLGNVRWSRRKSHEWS